MGDYVCVTLCSSKEKEWSLIILLDCTILPWHGIFVTFTVFQLEKLLEKLDVYESAVGDSSVKGITHIAAFPPAFEAVPRNPIVLDLAHNCVEFPSLENRMKKDKKGFISRLWRWTLLMRFFNCADSSSSCSPFHHLFNLPGGACWILAQIACISVNDLRYILFQSLGALNIFTWQTTAWTFFSYEHDAEEHGAAREISSSLFHFGIQ